MLRLMMMIVIVSLSFFPGFLVTYSTKDYIELMMMMMMVIIMIRVPLSSWLFCCSSAQEVNF